ASCQRCKNAISIKAAALCLSPSGIVFRKDRDLAAFQLSRQKRSKSVGVTPITCSHHLAGFSCAVRNIALALVTLSSITSWIIHHASFLVCPRSTNWPHMRARGPLFRILRSKGRAAPAFKLDGAALALFPERTVKLERTRTARGDGNR